MRSATRCAHFFRASWISVFLCVFPRVCAGNNRKSKQRREKNKREVKRTISKERMNPSAMLTADFQAFMPDPDFGPTSPMPESPSHVRRRGRPKTSGGGGAKSNKRARPTIAEDEDGGDAETVIRPQFPS